jgi:hypothetical protein
MYGPQIEKVMQVISFDNQQRLNQAERYHQLAQAMVGEEQAAQPRHNRLGDLVRRLSFRNRTAPAGSAS